MLLYLMKALPTMRYLVDGHNLIPHLPGLRLEAVDDEQELITRLQAFCAQAGHYVDVYFDNAPLGVAGTRRMGRVTAHFVRAGNTADAAIARRLINLGRSARQWCVVSSDRSVQAAARAAHAQVSTSQAFARGMQAVPGISQTEKGESPLDPAEVDEWLRIFQPGHTTASPPPPRDKKQDS